MRFSLTILLTSIAFLTPSLTHAVGVGVRPTSIDLTLRAGQATTTELLVLNTTQEPALYEVKADDYADRISASPTVFRLEAESSQIVQLTFQATKIGESATNISIVAHPLSSALAAASGVKVPIVMRVTGISLTLKVIGFGLLALVICALVWSALHLRRRSVVSKQSR